MLTLFNNKPKYLSKSTILSLILSRKKKKTMVTLIPEKEYQETLKKIAQ